MELDKIIKIALQELGTKESPRNSNNVKYNTDYYGKKVSGVAFPWCCVFVWWVFKQAGLSHLFCNGKKTALCEYVKNEMKSQIVKTPKKGDLVLFQFDKDPQADHIGIVLEVIDNNKFITIEGNTSTSNNSNGGEVMKRERKTKDVISFIRPKYDSKKVSYFPKYKGYSISIVVALKDAGVKDTSLTYRKKIGVVNNISNVGTATANSKMLKLLKDGKLIKP